MLAARLLKPPVPAAPKAVIRASYQGRPTRRSKIVCTTVSTRYMAYRILAVSRILLEILPTEGPGDSARIKCMARPSLTGRTAMVNTSTPMPPTQWVKLRQNSIL